MIEMKSERDEAYDIFVYGSGIEENSVSVTGNVSNTRDELKVNDSDSMLAANYFLNTKPREKPELKGTFAEYASSNQSEEMASAYLLVMVDQVFNSYYLASSSEQFVIDELYSLDDASISVAGIEACYWGDYTILEILDEESMTKSYSVSGRISTSDYVFDIEGGMNYEDADSGTYSVKITEVNDVTTVIKNISIS